ncbi:MAG: DUF72 domain-containing protein [Acidobacteria bacterium]|nr:MAG: DUF72 domain-containing protein [Acidobacteriota bacterium]PYQ24102.1 MAG: DUF72 domain-containing protein [Acidobacteriota bacterium]
MRVLVGTSGYSYKQWKGPFYPEKMKEPEMLGFYAQRFPTVEINNTFYRMPNRDLLARWSAETPDGFVFVLKAPQRITHQKRLANVAEELDYFLGTAETMGGKLGPLLFQLPPYLHKDLPRLRSFLQLLPAGRRAALEFRHETWFGDDVLAALRERGAALVAADTEEGGAAAEVTPTADWGYLRLRRPDYGEEQLRAWADRIQAQPWKDAFVFFKHEDEAKGPELAERLMVLVAG